MDMLVEKAVLYIEKNPDVSVSGLSDAGYGSAISRVKGNVNSLRKRAGVPTRERGQLYSEDWERLETSFREYMKENPKATEPDIRSAGYGGVFRHIFGFDLERAREICVKGTDGYTTQQLLNFIGAGKKELQSHLKRGHIERIGWGLYSGPSVRSYVRSLGIDVSETEQTQSQLPEILLVDPLIEPTTKALVRIYTAEDASGILGVSLDELPKLTFGNGIHDIGGRYFADSIDWLKAKLEGEVLSRSTTPESVRVYDFREARKRLGLFSGSVHNIVIDNGITVYKDGKFDANGVDWLAEKLARERLEDETRTPVKTRGRRPSKLVDENVRMAVLYIEENPDSLGSDLKEAGYRQAINRESPNQLRMLAGVPRTQGKYRTKLETWEELETKLQLFLKENPDATPDDIRAAHYGGVFKHRFGSDIERARIGESVEAKQQSDMLAAAQENKSPVKETVTSGPGIIVYTDDGIEYDPSKPDAIIGQNMKFRKAMDLAGRVSSENIDTLVIGETGTGKDFIVKYIHDEGARAGRPFVVYRCYRAGGDDRNYTIGELFGFRVGSNASRKGIIELAESGDLVLEDLQHLSDFGQLAFEDFLSDKRITVLGKGSRQLDVRFLSVADNSLKDKAKRGEFKSGLYYKLARVVINVPPLRERVDDIRLLASYFLDKHSKLQGKSKPRLSLTEVEELVKRDWEGNVKELENYMEASVLIGEIVIPQRDFSADERCRGDVAVPSFSKGKPGDLFSDAVRIEDAERILVEKALKEANGDRLLAAKMLGIGKSSLYRKLKKYTIE